MGPIFYCRLCQKEAGPKYLFYVRGRSIPIAVCILCNGKIKTSLNKQVIRKYSPLVVADFLEKAVV